jgi:phosphoethanolamine N-methyltransferase
MASSPLAAEDHNEPRETRTAMKSYWETHTSGGDVTNSTMMLMTDASAIDEAEQREILELLPDYQQKTVLELGCGIGRFTGHLAKEAAHVTAVDFIQKCIDENIRRHQHMGNVTFMCEDVTNLSLRPGGYDIVFSNWLQMYLDEDEVRNLARNIISWVKPGGIIFFRESCVGGPSGDKPRSVNPTFYRPHWFYTQLFSDLGLMLLRCCLVECYVSMKNKTNQYVWVFQKLKE